MDTNRDGIDIDCCSNVRVSKDVVISNIILRDVANSEETRPAIIMEVVKRARLKNVEAQTSPGIKRLVLKNSVDINDDNKHRTN